MNEYTVPTNMALIKCYKEKGLSYTVCLAKKLLETQYRKHESEGIISGVHGEVAETILELMLVEYCKQRNIPRFHIAKSLIVTIGDYTTEMDLVFITPAVIAVFECKCYSGDKIIVDKGTIKREGHADFDVYDQNIKHIRALHAHIKNYLLHGASYPYMSSYFRFDTGTVNDLRKDNDKSKFPITDINNLYELLDKYSEGKPCWRWDLINVIKKFEKSHKQLEERHLKQVGAK